MSLNIDLNQVILALADALDLVGIDEVGHGKRVGYMAFVCAEHLGLDQQARERLFNIGLLHDIGVSSTREHAHLVTEMQWSGADGHAVEGCHLLSGFAPLADFADVVLHHHTPWQHLRELESVDATVARDANLIFMVDRVDALTAAHYGKDLMVAISDIRSQLQAYSGSLFDPELIELFLEASRGDAFWMMLEPPHLDRFINDMSRHSRPRPMNHDELRQLAGIFGHVVDAKSRFTVSHSYGVASLARHLSELAGLNTERCEEVEISALLHDIGKLRIPDDILEKPGKLTDEEMAFMRRHSFETYQVLRRIEGLGDIALWAAYHHETTDGMGYPFRRDGTELGIESRIIAVADIFQALAQDRPYRGPMPAAAILGILEEQAKHAKLDASVVALVQNNLDGCYQAATRASPTEGFTNIG